MFYWQGVGRRQGGADRQMYPESGGKYMEKNKGKEDRVMEKEEGMACSS